LIYEDNSKYKVKYIGEIFSKDLISYKIIFIGRYGVGKTSIINKLMKKKILQRILTVNEYRYQKYSS